MIGKSKNTTNKTKRSQQQGFKVFVGGLSVNCEDKELRDYLRQFGTLLHCSKNRDENCHSKGYGFAAFRSENDQLKAVGKHHLLRDKHFEVRVLVDSERNSELLNEISKRKVFISNIREDMVEEDLQPTFEGFGPVEEVMISRDPLTQQSKGFGFVVFADAESLHSLLSNGKNKKIMKIMNQDIIVRAAIPKKDIDTQKKDPQDQLQHSKMTSTKKSKNTRKSAVDPPLPCLL